MHTDVQGSIVRLIPERSFGFIKLLDGSDIFFHGSGVRGATFADLAVGDRVVFDVVTDARDGRIKADNVVVL